MNNQWNAEQAATFNWTKVELKLLGISRLQMAALTFNWTKVELKHNYFEYKGIKKKLLIELR